MVLKINSTMTAGELRSWARRCGDSRAASRAYGVANALDGMSRAEAARLAGMDRQSLCEAVRRYNEGGVAALFDRPRGRPPQRLNEAERDLLAAAIRSGPDPLCDGATRWTRDTLAEWVFAQFGKSVHPASLSRMLGRMGVSWAAPGKARGARIRLKVPAGGGPAA